MAPAAAKENVVTQYLLSMYQPGEGTPAPDVLEAIMKQVRSLREEMKASGAWVASAGLHPPSTATVVRVRDGQRLTTDGPFVEGKEHIGGFTIINAADLDAALDWASKLGRITSLPIEVRPIRGEIQTGG